MTDIEEGPAAGRWYPVARSEEVTPGHIFHGRLLGLELALWRDREGRLNVWENRCPHRSVRLTHGIHLDDRIKCRYHGWEYASGSGKCCFVPAHPADPPRERIAVRSFPAREQDGLAWTTLGGGAGEPPRVASGAGPAFTLRSVVVRAPAAGVVQALLGCAAVPPEGPGADGQGAGGQGADGFVHARAADACTVEAVARVAGAPQRLTLIVQPASEDKSLVHGVVASAAQGAERVALLRAYNRLLAGLRDALESAP